MENKINDPIPITGLEIIHSFIPSLFQVWDRQQI